MTRLPAAFGLALAVFAGASAPALGQSSVEELAARLESDDPGARREAARELGEDGSAAAITVLSGAARDPDHNVRRTVLEALVSRRRTETAPGLIVFLEDEVEDHRREAIRGLVEMHARDPRAGRGARAVNWLLRREEPFVLDPLRPVAPEVGEALAGRLGDGEVEIRRLAAEALGALRAASEVGALGAAAGADPDEEVRRKSVGALGTVGTEEAGEALLALLRNQELRREVVRALGRMAYRSSGSAILAVYDEDPESDLGRDALEALARMGHPGARGTFYHELGHREGRRREFAAEGLGRLDDPSLADGLIRDFLREEDARAQLAFCFALVRLGHKPFVDRIVLSLDDRRLGEVARQYALELGSALLPEFLDYLEDPDRGVRLELISLIERIGDPDAIPALRAASEDEDREVADRARLAVRRLSANP